MLVPAILKKSEIESGFQKLFYTNDMFLITGTTQNWIPEIKDTGNNFQYAIIDKREKVIGYFDYTIDLYYSCAKNFCVVSFDKGNPSVVIDALIEFKKIINNSNIHRIEWTMVGSNPVEKIYDKICYKYNGYKNILHDSIKDIKGQYYNYIIYEIIKN